MKDVTTGQYLELVALFKVTEADAAGLIFELF